ncbi:hypothetical protein Tco_1478586 [Tanacetum coccineum]
MKRASKGYFGVITPLFKTMLVQHQADEPSIQASHETSPLRITSSPLLSPQAHPSTSQLQTTHVAEEATQMPHESPLQSVHSLRCDEGSLSLNELMVLCTLLSKNVKSLESELHQTKQTYSTAFTKLIKRVKKLEHTIKTSQARRSFKVVLSDDEEEAEDPSKQGRKISDIDKDPTISWVVLEEEEPTELVKDQGSGEKGEKEVRIRQKSQENHQKRANTDTRTEERVQKSNSRVQDQDGKINISSEVLIGGNPQGECHVNVKKHTRS